MRGWKNSSVGCRIRVEIAFQTELSKLTPCYSLCKIARESACSIWGNYYLYNRPCGGKRGRGEVRKGRSGEGEAYVYVIGENRKRIVRLKIQIGIYIYCVAVSLTDDIN